MAIYAPNELLAYAFDAYHRNIADDLGNVILNLYDDVAVRTANTMIWDMYGDKLPVWKNNDLSLHEVELSGNYRCQQIEINFYPDSPLFISTGFLPRVSSMRLNRSVI